MLKSCIRIIFVLSASLVATHTLAQDLSGWSDKTVCRLVKSDSGATYIEEATRRGIVCALNTLALNNELKVKRVTNQPQWSKYKDVIKTPMRDFVVPKTFSLVEDWETFEAYQAEYITGRFPGDLGFYKDDVDTTKCVNDLKHSTTTARLKRTRGPMVSQMCLNNLARWTLHNPEKGINAYKEILLHWTSSNQLQHASAVARQSEAQRVKNKKEPSYAYVMRSLVSNIAAHYAIYHRWYNFDQTIHDKVIDAIEYFYTEFDHYGAFKNRGSHFAKLCNLKKPMRILREGTNDHCGSANTRMAVGGILFGLEFSNQAVFDAGVRHTEVFIGSMDKNKMYAAQIGRGLCAFGYADQMTPAIDAIDFALERAFNFSFSDMKNAHGVTPGETYANLYTVALSPDLAHPYYDRRGQCDSYKNEYEILIKKWKTGEVSDPSIYHGAWNLKRYIQRAPGLAKKYYPKLYEKYNTNPFELDYMYGVQATAPATILRVATSKDFLEKYFKQKEKDEAERVRIKQQKLKQKEKDEAERVRIKQQKLKQKQKQNRLRLKKNAEKIKAKKALELVKQKEKRIQEASTLSIFELDGETLNLTLDKAEFIETRPFKLERSEEYLQPYQLHKGFIQGSLRLSSNKNINFKTLVFKYSGNQEQRLVINVDHPSLHPFKRHSDFLQKKCGSNVMEWDWLSFISKTNDIKSAKNQQCIYDYFKDANDQPAWELFRTVLGGTDSILDYLETNVER